MSFNLQGTLLIKYPVSPLRYIFLVTVTSVYSIGNAPSLFSNIKEASANPNDFLFWVPANMMSKDFAPLNDFILCSPSIHRMASDMLLFPEPFGPNYSCDSWSEF